MKGFGRTLNVDSRYPHEIPVTMTNLESRFTANNTITKGAKPKLKTRDFSLWKTSHTLPHK